MNGEPTNARRSALEYVHGGISVIPIRADGSKAPTVEWDAFKERRATDVEIEQWFRAGTPGVACVGGQVSGNLAILDHEYPDFAAMWAELVEAEFPGLTSELPQVLTPGKSGQPGKHYYLRSPKPLRSGKLAMLTSEEAERRTGDSNKRTAIELKAEGGYCLAPGCPATCHESGRLYHHVGGPFIEETPTLTDEQVETILSCARALTQEVPRKTEAFVGQFPSVSGAGRPGDVFNQRADWAEILAEHGWETVRQKEGVLYLRRPGKAKGISATAGYCQSERAGDLLCVFSANAGVLSPEEGKDHQCFSKFAAYALLNHKGDFRAAAKDLAAKGYGFDFGMSAAEMEAFQLAMKIKDIDDADAWADCKRKLLRKNQQKGWGLAEVEIDSVLITAHQEKILHDPRLLAAKVQQEINESISGSSGNHEENGHSQQQEPLWLLKKITSDEPEYLLRSPFWSHKSFLPEGCVRLIGKELLTWQNLRLAVMLQADVRIPDKIHAWDRLLQRLLDTMAEVKAPPDSRRPWLVAEFLYENLVRAKPARKNDKGDTIYGSGNPTRLEDGRIIVKSKWLVEANGSQADGFSRKEILAAMQRFGMENEQIGGASDRSRWWTISQVNMENLRDAVTQ